MGSLEGTQKFLKNLKPYKNLKEKMRTGKVAWDVPPEKICKSDAEYLPFEKGSFRNSVGRIKTDLLLETTQGEFKKGM